MNKIFLFGLLLCWLQMPWGFVYAQQGNTIHAQIEEALSEKRFSDAEGLINHQVSSFEKSKQADSLTEYVRYKGEVMVGLYGAGKAVAAIDAFVVKIKNMGASPLTLSQAYTEAGNFFGSIGRDNLGYKASQTAYAYALQIKPAAIERMGMIQRNMGVFAQRAGDISTSKKHHQQSLSLYHTFAKPDYENLYQGYNALGVIHWYSSQNDSALFYFKKALEALENTTPTAFNRYYRTAVIENNMAGIYGVQANTTAAITAMETTIRNLKLFQLSREHHPKKVDAVTFQMEAIDNLAGIYKELGDYSKALDLLLFSYEQKQQKLSAGDVAVYKSQVLIGQMYYAMRNYEKAIDYLKKGQEAFTTTEGDYLFWEGDACYGLALVYDQQKQIKQAERYYEMADSLYALSAQGNYDNIYLEFLGNAALFHAQNGNTAAALEKAHRAYQYVQRTEDESSMLPFYQSLSLSEVYSASGKYNDALRFSNEALDNVNNKIRKSKTLLDSVQTEFKKPKAILSKAKAEYELMEVKSTAGLERIRKDLNEALELLDRRKNIIQDEQDINLIIADHAELLEFIKKITLELYRSTGHQKYSDDLVSVHESSLYNRIRSRLDKRGELNFTNVPSAVLAQEKALRLAIPASLRRDKNEQGRMQGYFKAVDNWSLFLKDLQKRYPGYYHMKFESIFQRMDEVQQNIPASATVIRYVFVGDQLLALVADRQQQTMHVLDSKALRQQIELLAEQWMNPKTTGAALHELYQQLWAPLAKDIRHEEVIVIPDGILYHISFESLTAVKCSDFGSIAQTALINKHQFSYLYSLFLLKPYESQTSLKENFIAFAPGFNDDQKKEYAKSVRDTLYLDKSYLSLLPLPFTEQLARKMYGIFGGDLFSEERSTCASFKQHAGNHSIIHIGTHAESNNKYPELSRLIFSKEADVLKNDNSLFLYDIYGCDMRSQLTVLTACESGKPGFMDGEGMISLAHAFNYAGSESILTGLWKIDEQSSAVITEYFYENLLKGIKKDEALRQAKIKYLGTASGRMLAPQYWSGLVVMGDISPILIQEKNYWWIWIILAVGVLLGTGLWMGINRKNTL